MTGVHILIDYFTSKVIRRECVSQILSSEGNVGGSSCKKLKSSQGPLSQTKTKKMTKKQMSCVRFKWIFSARSMSSREQDDGRALKNYVLKWACRRPQIFFQNEVNAKELTAMV